MNFQKNTFAVFLRHCPSELPRLNWVPFPYKLAYPVLISRFKRQYQNLLKKLKKLKNP